MYEVRIMKQLNTTLITTVILLSISASWAADRGSVTQPQLAPMAPRQAPAATPVPIPRPTYKAPVPRHAAEATPVPIPKPARMAPAPWSEPVARPRPRSVYPQAARPAPQAAPAPNPRYIPQPVMREPQRIYPRQFRPDYPYHPDMRGQDMRGRGMPGGYYPEPSRYPSNPYGDFGMGGDYPSGRGGVGPDGMGTPGIGMPAGAMNPQDMLVTPEQGTGMGPGGSVETLYGPTNPGMPGGGLYGERSTGGVGVTGTASNEDGSSSAGPGVTGTGGATSSPSAPDSMGASTGEGADSGIGDVLDTVDAVYGVPSPAQVQLQVEQALKLLKDVVGSMVPGPAGKGSTPDDVGGIGDTGKQPWSKKDQEAYEKARSAELYNSLTKGPVVGSGGKDPIDPAQKAQSDGAKSSQSDKSMAGKAPQTANPVGVSKPGAGLVGPTDDVTGKAPIKAQLVLPKGFHVVDPAASKTMSESSLDEEMGAVPPAVK